MGGKSDSGAGSAYNYYGTIACLVCHGPVDILHGIVLDNKLAWEGPVTRGGPDYVTVTVPDRGILRFYWGTETQTQDPLLTDATNSLQENHPTYKGLAYAVLVDFLFGLEVSVPPNIQFIVTRNPKQTKITGHSYIDEQVNPACVLAEVLTSARAGADLADSELSSSFQVAADTLATRDSKTYISGILTSQQSLSSLVDEMSATVDLWLREAASGVIEAGVWPSSNADVTVTALPVVSAATLLSPFKPTIGSWDDVSNEWFVSFPDRVRLFKNSTVFASSSKARRIVGESKRDTVNRDFITRRKQALFYAQEYARANGRAKLAATIEVRRSIGLTLLPGSLFRLDVDLEPGGLQLLQVCRVLSQEIQPFGGVTLDIEADMNFAPVPYVPNVDPDGLILDPTPLNLYAFRVFETPYVVSDAKESHITALVQRSEVTSIGFTTVFGTVTGGPYSSLGNSIGTGIRGVLATTMLDETVGFPFEVIMDIDIDLDMLAVSPGAVAARDDELLLIAMTVNSGDLVETDGLYNIEILSVETITLIAGRTYAFDCLRGRLGTVPRDHLVGGSNTVEVWVCRRDNLNSLFHPDFLVAKAAHTPLFFKFVPYNQFLSRSEAACAELEFSFATDSEFAPVITWTTPADAITAVGSAPGVTTFAGSVSDQDANLVEFVASYTDPNGDTVTLQSVPFGGAVSHGFSFDVNLTGAGTHTVSVQARDDTGRIVLSTRVYSVAAAGIVDTPVITAQTNFVNTIPVYMSCTTAGSTIKYGFTPVSSTTPPAFSSTYSAPIVVSSTRKIWAKAEKVGLTDSTIACVQVYNTRSTAPYNAP